MSPYDPKSVVYTKGGQRILVEEGQFDDYRITIYFEEDGKSKYLSVKMVKADIDALQVALKNPSFSITDL